MKCFNSRNLFSILGLILFQTLALKGQQTGVMYQENLNAIGSRGGTSNVILSFPGETDVLGTPFFVDEFVNGTLVFEGGKAFKKIPLKYDVYGKNIHTQRIIKGSSSHEIEEVKAFSLYPNAGDSVYFEKIQYRPNESHFGHLIYKNQTALYLVYIKGFSKSDKGQAYSTQKDHEYTDTSLFYIVWPNGKTERVKKRPNAFAKMFPEKGKVMSDFIKKESIKPAEPQDLVKALQHFDELISR